MTTTFKSLALIACLFFAAVACETAPENEKSEVLLSVSANSIEFDEENPDNNTFTVTSNVAWYAESSAQSLKFEPAEGSAGETEITVKDINPGTTGVITVTTIRRNVEDVVKTEKVSVTRAKAEPKNYAWAEMPKVNVSKPNYKQVTHYANTVKTNQYVRNYSACYDTGRHNPMWVAYPLHACYTEGWGRTTPDPWQPDPKFRESEQSIIYEKDVEGYHYWSPISFKWDSKGFTKGHLLRSDDRRGAGQTINIQTFYPTNIAPEEFVYPDVHAELEGLLSDEWICRDTIYVVSGCWYDDTEVYEAWDASSWGNTTQDSKKCQVPNYQYKVYLRTKSGNTGKPIQECSAGELTAIGFWLPQGPASTLDAPALSTFARSVDEIERLTGGEFEFFPEAPDEVTASYNPADWGL